MLSRMSLHGRRWSLISENVFEKFYTELKECSADATKILLLMLLAVFYPFVAEIGFSVMLPIVIILESESEISRMLNWLDCFDIQKSVSASAKPKEIERALSSIQYGNAFFTLDNGRYTLENLQQISSSSRKMERGIEKQKMVVFFAVKEVPQKFEDFLEGTVFINEKIRITENGKVLRKEFIHDLVSFCMSHVSEIKNESDRENGKYGEDFSVFHVVGILLKIYLKTQCMTCNEIEKYEREVDSTVEKIIEDWEEVSDPEIYAEIFRKILYENSERIGGAFDRKKPFKYHFENTDEVIFFDDEFYYFSVELFHSLCKRIGNVRYIGAQLVSSKVVFDEGKKRRYFTGKIEIINEKGEIERRRLVKIAREKIDDPYGLSFEEILRQEEGETIHGNKTGERGQCLGICENC